MTEVQQNRGACWCLLVFTVVIVAWGYAFRDGQQPLSASRDDSARIIWRIDAQAGR